MRNLENEVISYTTPLIAEGIDIVIQIVPPFDENALSDELNAIDTDTVDGIAFVAVDSPAVRNAVRRLVARKLPVVTLVSDLPSDLRTHFIGIDNIWAGRTAGRLLGRFCDSTPGKIAVIAGGLMMRDHAARHEGFCQVLNEDFSHLEALPPIEARDNAELAERYLTALLAKTDGVVGIYSLGAGNRGVVAALRTIQSTLPVVVHELTQHSRDWLMQGTIDAVIRQDPAREARSAVRTLLALSQGKPLNKEENRVNIEIFLRDNLPQVSSRFRASQTG